MRSKEMLNLRSKVLAILANPKVDNHSTHFPPTLSILQVVTAVLADRVHVLKKSVEEARKRWLDHEESGLVDDLAKEGLYSRESRYPEAVRTLFAYLVTNKYGRRHPNVIEPANPELIYPGQLAIWPSRCSMSTNRSF